MKIPRPINRLIESFQSLPGIGPKTAQRLTFHLLHYPQEELEKFADALVQLKKGTKLCSICKNVTEYDVCTICDDLSRNKKQILVTASPLDAAALEKAGYKGVYHVLHGIIDPLNNIGPEEIFIKELIDRIENISDEVSFDSFQNTEGSERIEIILATNSNMEGESTSMYIARLIREKGFDESKVRITRIGRGLPVGGDIEYADDITLTRALEGRSDF